MMLGHCSLRPPRQPNVRTRLVAVLELQPQLDQLGVLGLQKEIDPDAARRRIALYGGLTDIARAGAEGGSWGLWRVGKDWAAEIHDVAYSAALTFRPVARARECPTNDGTIWRN